MTAPFRLYKARELAAAEIRVARALLDWEQIWLGRGACSVQITQYPPQGLNASPSIWYSIARLDDVPIFVGVHGGEALEIAARLMGRGTKVRSAETDHDSFAARFGVIAIASVLDPLLSTRLCESPVERVQMVNTLPQSIGQKYHGALSIDVTGLAQHPVCLLLSEKIVAHLIEPYPRRSPVRFPLTSRRAAIDSIRVQLQVDFSDDELTVGAVRGLQPGDVIRFMRKIDSPLAASIVGSKAGACFLGKMDRNRAVKLARNLDGKSNV
jgi:hypothetical protein